MNAHAAAWLGVCFGCVLPLLATSQAAAELPTFERVRALATPREIGSTVELTDQYGRAFRLEDLRGKVAFILFGFTNCPDVCPVAMERLRQLHDSGALDGERVMYVLISVDGERDTPDAMKEFLARYSADFFGLTAPASVVKPLAAQFSVAFFKGHAGHDTHYDVAHSPQIFVVDPAGRLRAELFGASLEAMSGVATALLAELR